jgi:hypothetical protein
MNYRAGMIGATLNVESQRAGGTVVRCHLPLGEPGKSQPPAKGTSRAKSNRAAVKPTA